MKRSAALKMSLVGALMAFGVFAADDSRTKDMNKGKAEVVNLGEVTAMRVTFEPGWRWSECVKPIAGTPSCQVPHLMHVISGRMGVRMDDGTETEFGPGDVGHIPAGHDAWIMGDDEFVGVDFQGGAVYAKPEN